MQKINWAKVILGGLLAGVIINVGAWVVDGILLADRWQAQMESMGKTMTMTGGIIAMLWVGGFVAGIVAVWIYAAIRATYGPGPGTAVTAGIMAWLLMAVLPNYFSWVFGMWGPRLLAASTVGSLVSVVLGTVAGAWPYKPAGEVVAVEPGVSA